MQVRRIAEDKALQVRIMDTVFVLFRKKRSTSANEFSRMINQSGGDGMTLRWSGGRLYKVLFATLVAFLFLFPANVLAQADERVEAQNLFGASVQMGAAHAAAYHGHKDHVMQALTYLISAARASKCIDPNPWIQILRELEAGASAQSVFPKIRALVEMPNGLVLNQIYRYRCRCDESQQDDKRAFCDQYAKTAVNQNEENLKRNCGYKGDQWQSNYSNHFDWCMVYDRGVADSEKRLRDEELKRCNASGPNGGAHDRGNSFNYVLAHDTQIPNGQDNWRWCRKCQGLFYGGYGEGLCPAGGPHDRSNSFNYVLAHDTQIPNGQDNWRWCRKCQGLFYGGYDEGLCPAGGRHDRSNSYNYVLVYDTQIPNGQDNWRWCRKCQGLFYGGYGGGRCPAQTR